MSMVIQSFSYKIFARKSLRINCRKIFHISCERFKSSKKHRKNNKSLLNSYFLKNHLTFEAVIHKMKLRKMFISLDNHLPNLINLSILVDSYVDAFFVAKSKEGRHIWNTIFIFICQRKEL